MPFSGNSSRVSANTSTEREGDGLGLRKLTRLPGGDEQISAAPVNAHAVGEVQAESRASSRSKDARIPDTDSPKKADGGWVVAGAARGPEARAHDSGSPQWGGEGGRGLEVSIDVRRVLTLPSVSPERHALPPAKGALGPAVAGAAPAELGGEDDTTSDPSTQSGEGSVRGMRSKAWEQPQDLAEDGFGAGADEEGEAGDDGREDGERSTLSPLSCSTMFSTLFTASCKSPNPLSARDPSSASERAPLWQPTALHQQDSGPQPPELESGPSDAAHPHYSAAPVVPKLDLARLRYSEDEAELALMAPRAVEPTNPLRPPKRSLSIGGQNESSLLCGPSVSPLMPSHSSSDAVSSPEVRGAAGDTMVAKESTPRKQLGMLEEHAEGWGDELCSDSEQARIGALTTSGPGAPAEAKKMEDASIARQRSGMAPTTVVGNGCEDGQSDNGAASTQASSVDATQPRTLEDGKCFRGTEGARASSVEAEYHLVESVHRRPFPKEPVESTRGVPVGMPKGGPGTVPDSPTRSSVSSRRRGQGGEDGGLWSGSEFGHEMEDTADSNSDSDHDGIVFSSRLHDHRHQQPPTSAPPMASRHVNLPNGAAAAPHLPSPLLPSAARGTAPRSVPPLAPNLLSSPRSHPSTPSHLPPSSSRARRGLFTVHAEPSPIPFHLPSHHSPAPHPPSSLWLADRSQLPPEPGATTPGLHPSVPPHLPLVGPGVPALPPRSTPLKRRHDASLPHSAASTSSAPASLHSQSVSPYAALDSLKKLAQQSVQTYRAAALRAYRAISPLAPEADSLGDSQPIVALHATAEPDNHLHSQQLEGRGGDALPVGTGRVEMAGDAPEAAPGRAEARSATQSEPSGEYVEEHVVDDVGSPPGIQRVGAQDAQDQETNDCHIAQVDPHGPVESAV